MSDSESLEPDPRGERSNLLELLGVIGPTEDGSVEVLVAARGATQSAGKAWSISRVPLKLASLQDAAS